MVKIWGELGCGEVVFHPVDSVGPGASTLAHNSLSPHFNPSESDRQKGHGTAVGPASRSTPQA